MVEAVEAIIYTEQSKYRINDWGSGGHLLYTFKKIVSIGDATEVFIGLEIYIINYWGYDGYTYT